MKRRLAPVGRLAIQFGLAFALSMALVGVVVFVVAELRIASRIDAALAYHSHKFVADTDEVPRPTALVAGRIADWQRRKVMSERTYLLFDVKGRQVAGRLGLPPLREGYSDVLYKGGGRTWQKGRALTRRLPDGGLFVVVQQSEAAESLRSMLFPLIGAVLGCALLAGLVATFIFARLTARRLHATQTAAAAIAAGDLSRRIAADTLDGMFAAQAHSLNAMLDRMELIVNTQRQFASAVAHDLRTPLTRLKGMLAQARSASASSEGNAGRTIEQAEHECAAIIAIFEALLRLSEIEAGHHANALQIHALDELVRDAVETMEPVLADAGSILRCALPDADLSIIGDEALITQLLINLLENVVTHTPAGTRATVSLAEDGDRAVLTIADDGPGLAPGDCQRVLRPFERGSAARAHGSGLGLAIARAIVEFHGGGLELGENSPGLVVTIRLPLAAGGSDQGLRRVA